MLPFWQGLGKHPFFGRYAFRETLESEFMDVSPSNGEPSHVFEVALLEVCGGKTAYLDMVTRHTGNGYVGSACGEVHDRYASLYEGTYGFA